MFEPSLSLAFLFWMHPAWLLFHGMCLANFIQAIIISPFTIHLWYWAPIFNSQSHRSCTSNRRSYFLRVDWFFGLKHRALLLLQQCSFIFYLQFKSCVGKLGFWSSKMTLRFSFIHLSIHDVAYIWTTSRFHHLSNFVFLRSPVSTPWAFYPQLFSSHFWYLRWDTFQTSLFAFSYDMNTSVHVFPLEARPQFTRATLYTCFQNCRICDSVAHSIGTFVTMRLCNVIRARPFHFEFAL